MHIKVQTTQNVDLYFTPASLGDRILAYLIDVAILIGWVIFMILLTSLFPVLENSLIFFMTGIILMGFYDLLCEIFFNGQSIGKKALNLKVVKLDGTKPSLSAYLLRWLFLIIDTKLFSPVVALIAISASEKSQRIGDIVAGTTVIKLSNKVTIEDIDTVYEEENYEVTFPQASNLSDQDVQVIRNVLKKSVETDNLLMLQQAVERVKTVLAVSSSLPDIAFLQKVIDDYNYIHTR